jgi:general secretion pathway protein I
MIRGCKRGHSPGFTLVEVLVALAIVAVALAAGLRASGALVMHAQRQGEQFLAQLCAENELVRLRLARQFPEIGQIDFDCQQGGQSLLGQLQVSATPNPNFRRIEARVISQDRRPLLSLVTVMGRS